MPPRVGVLHAPQAAVTLRDLLLAARGLCTVVVMVRASVATAHPGLVDLARGLFETVVVRTTGSGPPWASCAWRG